MNGVDHREIIKLEMKDVVLNYNVNHQGVTQIVFILSYFDLSDMSSLYTDADKKNLVR